jgi:hypothetical protein
VKGEERRKEEEGIGRRDDLVRDLERPVVGPL